MNVERIAAWYIVLFGTAALLWLGATVFLSNANSILWLGVGLCGALLAYYFGYYWR